MKATYNSKTGKFMVIWKDFMKEAKGEKSPYGRKMVRWDGNKRPTKKEIEQHIHKWLAYAAQEEKNSKAAAEAWKQQMALHYGEGVLDEDRDINAPKNAIRYLLKCPISTMTKSDVKGTQRQAKRATKTLIEFLRLKHPSIKLHEIKKEVIIEYLEHYSFYASTVISQCYIYLGILWNHIIDEFEESEIKYVNHWKRYKITDLVKLKQRFKREDFKAEDLAKLLFMATQKESQTNRWKKACKQNFVILYFLMVTGWRKNEVINLRWSQVDLEKRTITVTHKKTRNSSGAKTVIFITPLMRRILDLQKSIVFDGDKIFAFGSHTRTKRGETEGKGLDRGVARFLKLSCEKLGILKHTILPSGKVMSNYCIHSLRHTVITQLSLAKFSPEKRRYLVGHAQKDVEGTTYTHFEKYPEQSTRDLIQHMEKLINAELNLNVLLNGVADGYKMSDSPTVELDTMTRESLKNNFWTDAAITHLLTLGLSKLDTNSFIHGVNRYRLEQGENDVTPALMERYIVFMDSIPTIE